MLHSLTVIFLGQLSSQPDCVTIPYISRQIDSWPVTISGHRLRKCRKRSRSCFRAPRCGFAGHSTVLIALGGQSHSVPFGIFTASKAKPVAGGEELYTLPESEKSQTAVPRFLFDPKLWVASFLQHSNPKSLNPVKLRALRVLVQIGTCQACVRNQFFLPDGTAVELKKTVMEKAARGTIRFDSEHKFNVPKALSSVGRCVLSLVVLRAHA